MPSNIAPAASIVSHCHSYFQELLPLYIFLSLKEKKEDKYFDRRKICCNNSIRGSRSVYDKISQDSKISVIYIIIA